MDDTLGSFTEKPLYEQSEKIATQQQRLKNVEINQALFGLLAYFEDHQIKQRSDEKNKISFYQDSEQGANSRIRLSFSFRGKHYTLPVPMFLKVRNVFGEWPSFIHFMPKKFGSIGRTHISVQDSNLFSTAFCLFSLYHVHDELKHGQKSPLATMRSNAHKAVESFRRINAYNFWPQQPACYGQSPRVAPLNFWAQIADGAARLYSHDFLQALRQRFEQESNLPDATWVKRCLNDKENPNGADALFNIANDADDSSVSIALQFVRKNFLPDSSAPDFSVLKEISRFRDVLREGVRRHPAESWRKKNSGAFLTWLRDENLPTFSQAEQGLIPGGINNVDIVVNANVLFAMALTDNTDLPGYQESCQLMVQAIEKKHWPQAGLYYPQAMIFPYAISRAIREGQISHEGLLCSQKHLLQDVLNAAQACDSGDSKNAHYAFSGGADPVCHLSTALALITLLNLGETVAKQANCLPRYRQVLSGGIAFLLAEVSFQRPVFKVTAQQFTAPANFAFIASWQDGLFFSSSYWDLSHWRSEAITNAAVLELLSKYLLAYDLFSEQGLLANDKKLCISSYCYGDMKAGKWLTLKQAVDYKKEGNKP